jgi:hypothetical protein
MIPMFKAKEEEAQQKYDRLKELKNELVCFSTKMGIPSLERRSIKPQIQTNFMSAKDGLNQPTENVKTPSSKTFRPPLFPLSSVNQKPDTQNTQSYFSKVS